MYARDKDIFSSMNLFIWIRFLPLNPRLLKTLISNFYPSLLRGNLAIFPGFSVMLRSLRKRHSYFIHTYVIIISYVLKGRVKSGCGTPISIWY